MDESFLSFLKDRKELLHNKVIKEYHFVLGNEAADLDSIVSSLIYSFYMQRKYEDSKEENVHSFPIIWIEEESLCLRTEVIALFKNYNFNPKQLLYKNDINFEDLIKNDDIEIKVTLVDHNHKTCHDNLTGYIHNIIDHHVDSHDHKDDKVIKHINLVGSCCTLIAEEIYYNKKEFLLIKPVADFLLSAILVDTINLDLHAGRTTELDIFMAEILSQYSTIDSDVLFKELQDAKMNINMLSTYDIFRKDFKKVQIDFGDFYIGFSAAALPPVLFLERDDFIETAKTFSNQQNIKLLIICFLCYNNDGSVERYLSVYTEDENIKDNVMKQLKENKEKLQLEEKDDVFKGLLKHGSQHSRKVILPMVKSFFSQ